MRAFEIELIVTCKLKSTTAPLVKDAPAPLETDKVSKTMIA